MVRVRYRTFIVLFILFVLASSLSPKSVFAISNPDSISIQSVKAFRNIAETADQMYLIEYKITYSSDPSEDSRDAFFVALGDGTTLLFTNDVRNYGHSFASIYLSASNALTWESTSYFAWVSGNPTLFPTLTLGVNKINLSIISTDWIDGTLDGTTPTVLGNEIIRIVENIERSTDGNFLTSNDKLNTSGSDLVTDIIPGIRTFVPGIFAQTASFPSPTFGTFTRPFPATLEANRGTRLTESLETIGILATGKTGSGDLVGMVLFTLLGISLLGGIYAYSKDGTTTMIVALPLIFIGTKVGVVPLALVFAVFLMVIILFGVTFILGRLG